ncbi:hypothetical protein NKH18_39450 [Streptomyces sp. M10(2022)]
MSNAQGVPLTVAVSGANMHDSLAFKPLILGIPAVRSRRGPGGAGLSNSARTRRTSPPNASSDCASVGSSRASRGQASSPASTSTGTAGRSNGRSLGSSATAA